MMEEILYGKNPILEALRSGREMNRILVAEGSQRAAVKPVLDEAKRRGIVYQFVPRQKLDQAVGHAHHQGVVAYVAAYSYVDLDDLITRAKRRSQAPFLLLLDGIEDPHNLGSILRSGDAAGVDGVIIPKRRAAGLTQAVAKASAGAIEYVPVSRVANLAQTIERLKEEGFWITGTDASARLDYRQVDYTLPTALVIGSEGRGISRLVREKCDHLVKIPMAGKVNSLNASVASAILMYEVWRQRHPVQA